MPRLTKENVERAERLVALYPQPRSALIPLLHLAQEQDGWVTDDAMCHIAELLGITPAEVLGTCSFYEMFKRKPVGRYLVNVCTNISCMLLGGYELLEHLEKRLDVKAGSTTADGTFTLDEVECIAACGQAPCLLVNYRLFGPLTHDDADRLIDDLGAGRLSSDVPPHGTTNRVRRTTARQATPAAATAPAAQDTPPSPPEGPGSLGPANKDETAPTREPAPPKKAAAPSKKAPAKKRAPRKKP